MAKQLKTTRTFIMIGGKLCLDFINTVSNYGSAENRSDYFKEYGNLLGWSVQVGVYSKNEAAKMFKLSEQNQAAAETALARSLAFREALYQIFTCVIDNKPVTKNNLKVLNEFLTEAMSRAQIVQTAEGFEWEWIEDGKNLDSMLWRVARSAAELLNSDSELARVKVCSDHICLWLFLDQSKNQSRRWCDMGDCGSRAKSRRFYERSKKTSITKPLK